MLQKDKRPWLIQEGTLQAQSWSLYTERRNASARPEVVKRDCSQGRAQRARAVFANCFPAPTAKASKL